MYMLHILKKVLLLHHVAKKIIVKYTVDRQEYGAH
jgi:hypothetical protein